jgi:hypothetical protein
MKKIILTLIFLTLVFNLNAESKIDELLKSDKEKYKSMEIETKDKRVAKNGYIENIKGEIFLQYEGNNSWVQAVEKSIVKEKTTVITMNKSSARIKMSNETFINIGAKTKIYFEKMVGEPDKEELTETGIKLFWGKIYSNVKKRVESGGKYEVKTGSVVAGVRGTQYMVSAMKNGENEITVYDGIVYVRKIDEEIEILLNKNEKIKVGRDGKIETLKHKEIPPEEEVKDESLIQNLKETTEDRETTAKDESNIEREYTDKMIEDKIEQKSKNTGTNLNIYIK